MRIIIPFCPNCFRNGLPCTRVPKATICIQSNSLSGRAIKCQQGNRLHKRVANFSDRLIKKQPIFRQTLLEFPGSVLPNCPTSCEWLRPAVSTRWEFHWKKRTNRLLRTQAANFLSSLLRTYWQNFPSNCQTGWEWLRPEFLDILTVNSKNEQICHRVYWPSRRIEHNVLLAAEVWDLKPKCFSLNESS